MRYKSLLTLSLLAVSLPCAAVRSAESQVPATALIPQQAVLVVQIRNPKAIVDQLFSERVKAAVKKLPFYDQALDNPGTKQAMNLVKYFQTKHDADIPAMVDALAGGGITFAVGPTGEVLLIVDAKDKAFLDEVHDFFKMMAQGDAEKAGDSGRVASADYRGVTGWKFGPNEVHAIIGNRLLVSNKPDVLKGVIDLRDAGTGSLADSTSYQKAVAAAGKDAQVIAYANMDVLKNTPDLQKSLNASTNPLGMLLLAPLQAALREATWLSAGACLTNDTLQIKFISDGTADAPDSPRGFAALAKPGDGVMPNLDVPRRIAGFSFYRDLHKFYAAKDELFPERTSGLIFFENMMGIFFTGRDLTEEVLAGTLPDTRVVVAQQQFNAKTGVPEVQFPGFAIVMRLKDREKFAPVVEEAWQKAVGLINFTRGQQALPGLIIDRPEYHGTKYTMSYFSVADEPDAAKADVRFNFQPSLAFQNDYLILSSTRDLTENLIDSIKKESEQKVKPVAGIHTLGMLDGQNLASILDANRNTLVRQNMVEDGNSRQEAEAQIGILLTIAQHVRDFTIKAGSEKGMSQMTLTLGYELN